MSRASVLARGRRMAEASMVDTCVIERIVGTTTDPETGQVADQVVTVYSGKCRVQERGGYPRDITTSVDQPQLAVARELQLPVVGSEGVRAGDRVTFTASVNDPGLVGVVAWLRGEPAKTEATARRFHMEEIRG